jgi:hypothetical protein
MATKKKMAATRAKLSKFESQLDEDEEFELLGGQQLYSAPSIGSKAGGDASSTSWKNVLVGCGSNTFGQLNLDLMDLMSTSMKVRGLRCVCRVGRWAT